mmetsp:Transcript_14237/g.10296  ORF Transcript_14237/g.10296 Transcript_14237/m.10296 type:complete len:105 (-) Transcript_14237:344-658(-)
MKVEVIFFEAMTSIPTTLTELVASAFFRAYSARCLLSIPRLLRMISPANENERLNKKRKKVGTRLRTTLQKLILMSFTSSSVMLSAFKSFMYESIWSKTGYTAG